MSYFLKTFIEQNYPNLPAQEIYADLSTSVTLEDDLTISELVTFFTWHPEVEVRLKNFVANMPQENDPSIQVWGVANMALRLLTIPGVEINPTVLQQGIAVLRTANLLTESEYESVQPYITRQSNQGLQTLGYLPTVEQIQAAIDLDWPTQN
jgi:hypothetical protein